MAVVGSNARCSCSGNYRFVSQWSVLISMRIPNYGMESIYGYALGLFLADQYMAWWWVVDFALGCTIFFSIFLMGQEKEK